MPHNDAKQLPQVTSLNRLGQEERPTSDICCSTICAVGSPCSWAPIYIITSEKFPAMIPVLGMFSSLISKTQVQSWVSGHHFPRRHCQLLFQIYFHPKINVFRPLSHTRPKKIKPNAHLFFRLSTVYCAIFLCFSI